LLSIAITIPKPTSISNHESHASKAISNSLLSRVKDFVSFVETKNFLSLRGIITSPFSNSSKFHALASDMINFTSHQNFGHISLAFGLQTFFAIFELSIVIISFTFSSSLIISL
jgi:hypothetical protein